MSTSVAGCRVLCSFMTDSRYFPLVLWQSLVISHWSLTGSLVRLLWIQDYRHPLYMFNITAIKGWPDPSFDTEMCHTVLWDVEYGKRCVKYDTAYYTKYAVWHIPVLICYTQCIYRVSHTDIIKQNTVQFCGFGAYTLSLGPGCVSPSAKIHLIFDLIYFCVSRN